MSEATAEAGETAPPPKLAYEIEINQPDLPKGALVQIPGLGTFENGKTYDVNVNEAEAYRIHHTSQAPVYDDETHEMIGTETKIGPTLLQASQNMYGVEVTTYGKQPEGGDS